MRPGRLRLWWWSGVGARSGSWARFLRCAAHDEAVSSFGRNDDVLWVGRWVGREEQATAKAKCGGLSTAQRTVKLSVASVEMTILWVGIRRHTPGAKAPLSCGPERPKAEALGYLEATAKTATATATARATARARTGAGKVHVSHPCRDETASWMGHPSIWGWLREKYRQQQRQRQRQR
jgi:hypothetical protein